MARKPYEPLPLDVELRPAAAPIDTYVQPPQVQRDDSLVELARGLQSLNGGLQSFMNARQEKQDREDAIRAEADFHKNNGIGFAEGVRRGSIPAQYSQTYMRTYKRVEGDVAGSLITQKFQAAYDAWGDKGNPDPRVFDAFLHKFIKENLGTDDPDVLAGVLPRLRTLTQNATQQNTADVSKITKQRANHARAAQIDGTITSENETALTNRKAPNWKGTVEQIHKFREEHIKAGGDEATTDNFIVDAVTARAMQLRSEGPKLLDEFFKSKVPGKDYTWGSTPYGREQQQKAIEHLETLGRREVAENRQARNDANKKALDDVTKRTIDGIVGDPNKPLDEALIKEGEKLDGDFRVKALGWQKTILGSRGNSDPKAMTQLHWDIVNGGGMGAIRRAMESGTIGSAEDLKSVLTLNDTVEKHGKRVTDILSTGSAQSILATIKERTLSKDDLGSLFSPNGLSDVGLAAQLDFRRQLLDWSVKNPSAGPIEVEEAIAKIGAGIVGRLSRADGGTGAAQYARPQDAPQNPYGGPQAAPAPAPATPPPAAPQPAPAPSAAPPAAPSGRASEATPSDVMRWFGTLPPEVQKKAADQALSRGESLLDAATKAYQLGVSRGAIQPPQRRSDLSEGATIQPASLDAADAFRTSEDLEPAPEVVTRVAQLIQDTLDAANAPAPKRNYQLAVLNDDPQVARILDFIAGPESSGNYDAYFSNAGSKKDLSKMTFDEVFRWSRRRGTKSSATGRYQFMFKTAMGLKEEMGLTGDEKFTPELQDRMALVLLKRRGLDEWRAGRITTKQFALNLAKEWASLPDPRTGSSYYAGDGLNKSLVSTKSVFKALEGDEA